MDEPPLELCEAGVLQRLLERHGAGARAGHVSVAFACGPAIVEACLDGARGRAAPIGCLAKLVTATLVARAAERGQLCVDSSARDLLGVDAEVLRGITVRHLLEHTHGVDDSLLAAPRYRGGFIDLAELAARVAAAPRWTAPGTLYSYGNLGAWLLAAALERLHGRAFAALVRDLLQQLGIEAARRAAATVCAATGVGLSLTAEELTRFGASALWRERAMVGAQITPLPGWHPLERGVCLGWKSAGEGWFGHQSAWPGASSYVRVHPRRELALAVVARDQAAGVIALGVLGRHLPELFEGRSRLPAAGSRALCSGVYAQAARVVVLTSSQRGISAAAWERDEHGAARAAPLRSALVVAGGVLFAQPASELVPFLQAVNGADGEDWLWNGRFVLRRAG